MTDVNAHSKERRTAAPDPPDSRRRRCAVRRRVVVALFLALFLVVAIGVNYRPISHYFDAQSRLEQVTAEVAALEERSAQLHTELSRAMEPGYLEVLARQELTYARSDEELFIITGDDGAGAAAGLPEQSVVPPSAPEEEDGPGFLERMLNGISDLF
jgi:cell division protein FtsB